MNRQLPPADYDVMVVGDEFGPVELTVDEHFVQSYAYAIGDFNPWYLHDSPFGGPIAPASLLADEVLALWATKYDANTDKGLHAKQELRFLEPVKLGQKVILRSKFIDKYIRRGKPYVATEGEALAEDGRKLMTFWATEMVGMERGLQVGEGTANPPTTERIVPNPNYDLPVAERAAPGLPIGTPLPTLTKGVTLKQMFAFSGREARPRNMHTDTEIAQSIGLPDALAQGLQTTGYLNQLCTEFFGESWFTTGWIMNSYLKPVYAKDVLQIKGAVSGHGDESGADRLVVDIWCETEEGGIVTIGRASARVG